MKHFQYLDTPGPFSGIDYRRTTRVERAIPLTVCGLDKLGQPFQENSWTISCNLHGCRYRSRHDCRPGTWISVHIGEPGSAAKCAAARAQVKSIHAPESARESYQIGIELECPGNIWKLCPPPADWLRIGDAQVANSRSTSATVPEQDPMIIKMFLPSKQVFRQGDERDISAKGKLQQEADAAVESALAVQLESAVSRVISVALERMDGAVLEIERRLSARLSEAVLRATQEFEDAATSTFERGFNRIVEVVQTQTREAAVQTEHRAEEVRSSLEVSRDFALTEFRRLAEIHTSLIASRIEQRLAYSLAALDAEHRNACQARLRTLENEIVHLAAELTNQRRHELKTFFDSCLIGAIHAIEQQSTAALGGLTQESQNSPPGTGGRSAPTE